MHRPVPPVSASPVETAIQRSRTSCLGKQTNIANQIRTQFHFLEYVNFEFYVQDDWKVTRKLTVNAGIRYSYFPSPTDSNNTLVNFVPSLFNPANAPAIDPVSGNMVAGNNAATYTNGLIFPKGAACAAAQAVAPLVQCSPTAAASIPVPITTGDHVSV